MEQFKHTGQLLFNATFFFLFLTRTHATHTNRGVGGGISAERAHIWIDMLQFTGPRQDRGGKSIDFFANMAACWSWGHINFHHSDVVVLVVVGCHTCFASFHGNEDHPSQRRSGRWWEANLGSLKSTLHEMPSTTLCLSVSLCVHHLFCLSLSCAFCSPVSTITYPHRSNYFLVFPHQLGKISDGMNKSTGAPGVLMELASSRH